MCHEIGTCPDTVSLLHVDEKTVCLALFPFACILLEDDQVTAYLRVGILREQVVRQSDGRHQVGMAHYFLTYRNGSPGIHDTLRGDECNDPAVMHCIQCL